jgi:hypothetical protein
VGIFDALEGRVTLTATQIAEKLQLVPERADRFLRALVCFKVLELRGDGKTNARSLGILMNYYIIRYCKLINIEHI